MTTTATPIPIDFLQAQTGYHRNAEDRRKAREGLVAEMKRKAQAEHDFRKARAIAYAKHRNAGKGQEESRIHAEADAAHLAMERDMADAEAKGWTARLAELEAERASLRQLADWSREAA